MAIEELMIYPVVATGIANICLLLGLLYVYLGSHKKVKSKFTTGLVLFASLFLLQNILSTGFLLVHGGFHEPVEGVHLFLINIIECIAFSILLKISWE